VNSISFGLCPVKSLDRDIVVSKRGEVLLKIPYDVGKEKRRSENTELNRPQPSCFTGDEVGW